MNFSIDKVVQKILDKADDIDFGNVTVTFTVHDKKITKIEYEVTEKEILKYE